MILSLRTFVLKEVLPLSLANCLCETYYFGLWKAGDVGLWKSSYQALTSSEA